MVKLLIRISAGLIFFAIIIWTTFWFIVVNQVDSNIDQTLSTLTKHNFNAKCSDISFTGFPFEIGFQCKSFSIVTPNRKSLKINYIEGTAGFFAPRSVNLRMKGINYPQWNIGDINVTVYNFGQNSRVKYRFNTQISLTPINKIESEIIVSYAQLEFLREGFNIELRELEINPSRNKSGSHMKIYNVELEISNGKSYAKLNALELNTIDEIGLDFRVSNAEFESYTNGFIFGLEALTVIPDRNQNLAINVGNAEFKILNDYSEFNFGKVVYPIEKNAKVTIPEMQVLIGKAIQSENRLTNAATNFNFYLADLSTSNGRSNVTTKIGVDGAGEISKSGNLNGSMKLWIDNLDNLIRNVEHLTDETYESYWVYPDAFLQFHEEQREGITGVVLPISISGRKLFFELKLYFLVKSWIIYDNDFELYEIPRDYLSQLFSYTSKEKISELSILISNLEDRLNLISLVDSKFRFLVLNKFFYFF